MTEDGYFKTGDIGMIDEDGFLKITDRKKDIIITANGKNIAPQLIESRIGQDYYFEQMVVFGDKENILPHSSYLLTQHWRSMPKTKALLIMISTIS